MGVEVVAIVQESTETEKTNTEIKYPNVLEPK